MRTSAGMARFFDAIFYVFSSDWWKSTEICIFQEPPQVKICGGKIGWSRWPLDWTASAYPSMRKSGSSLLEHSELASHLVDTTFFFARLNYGLAEAVAMYFLRILNRFYHSLVHKRSRDLWASPPSTRQQYRTTHLGSIDLMLMINLSHLMWICNWPVTIVTIQVSVTVKCSLVAEEDIAEKF